MRKIWLLFLVIPFICSCSNDGLLTKKFVKRMNAHEFNSASTYIFPGDHAKLKLFTDVMHKNPDMVIKILEKENCMVNNQKAISVKFQFINATQYFNNYMSSISNYDTESETLTDTIIIKETNDGERLTFSWANIDGDNLKSAVIGENYNAMNIRSGNSKQHTSIGVVNKGDHIIINGYDKGNWIRCFSIDEDCNVLQGYIYKPYLSTSSSTFFDLNWFDRMSILIAFGVLALVGILLFIVYAIKSAICSIPILGWLIIVGLFLGLLYCLYEVLEHIIFELTLINLPY